MNPTFEFETNPNAIYYHKKHHYWRYHSKPSNQQVVSQQRHQQKSSTITTTTVPKVEKRVVKKKRFERREHLADGFKCEYEECPKRFKVMAQYRAHIRRHANKENKKYVCEVCNNCFVQNSSLKTHLRIHTGEKPYPCEVCGKLFSDQSTCIKHKRIHTKEKPYDCTFDGCDAAFSQSGNRNRHYKTHHNRNQLNQITERIESLVM